MGIPKISIGLPVYNGERYLRLALDCILQQDFTDFEVIISDNASTDSTKEICRDYAARDKRFQYFRNETNIGAAANFNRVFKLARAEFFKWATHDDEFHFSLVRRCLETFEQSPRDTVLVFSRAVIIDETGRVTCPSPDTINPSFDGPILRLASLALHGSYAHPLWGLSRAEALRRTRLMGCIDADHILLAELAMLGRLVEIPEVLYRERRHPNSAIVLYPTAAHLLAWHDPRKAKAWILLPHWARRDLEYLRAMRHIHLSWAKRVLCCCLLGAIRLWRWLLEVTYRLRYRMGLYRRKKNLLGPTAGVSWGDH